MTLKFPTPPLPLPLPLRSRLSRFLRHESGAAAVSYVVMLPVVFGLFLMMLDSGFSTMRAALLDRAVDITARSVRTGVIASPTLANIKTDLCSRMAFFPDCATQLKVQIIAVPRNTFATPSRTIACADQGAALAPVRSFVAGQQNGLAVLRACMDITKFTPTALLAGPGGYKIHAETIIAGNAT